MNDSSQQDALLLILKKQLTKTPLSASEQTMLEHWLASSDHNRQLWQNMQQSEWLNQQMRDYTNYDAARIWQKTIALRPNSIENTTPIPRLRNRRNIWIAAAALLILAISSGIYYFNNQSYKSQKSQQITVQTKEPHDIAPGSNRAILTINNNQNIDLSTNKTSININNTITYSDGEKIADAGQLLQLTTPRGGQYQAVLPDGSKVWLNAASSIKFPSKFSDKERKVEVTGEVYFEIAKDANKPFKVHSSEQEIEVLGTAFNINAYNDEARISTTLIEGAVKVSSGKVFKILSPGQQTNYINNTHELQLNPHPDLRQVLSWQRGMFEFRQASIDEVMRQIRRWYNVEVVYQGVIPETSFGGVISRKVPLSELLELFSGNGIAFRIEGRQLMVTAEK